MDHRRGLLLLLLGADSGHAVDNGVGNVPIMGFDAWCANPRARSQLPSSYRPPRSRAPEATREARQATLHHVRTTSCDRPPPR
jgi:hypothetical protein